MIYTAPENVRSPRDFVRNLEVIFDGGEEGFSLARLNWEASPCYAIRWNIARREWDDEEKISERKRCVGMPTSRGYPVWFVLPDEIIARDPELWRHIHGDG